MAKQQKSGEASVEVSFGEVAQAIGAEVAALLVKKQKAYGPKNILNCPAGVQTGLVVRLFDKLARIQNLTSKGENPDWESLEDTWMDIMGYGMIGLMIQRGVFELPLEGRNQ